MGLTICLDGFVTGIKKDQLTELGVITECSFDEDYSLKPVGCNISFDYQNWIWVNNLAYDYSGKFNNDRDSRWAREVFSAYFTEDCQVSYYSVIPLSEALHMARGLEAALADPKIHEPIRYTQDEIDSLLKNGGTVEISDEPQFLEGSYERNLVLDTIECLRSLEKFGEGAFFLLDGYT